MPNLSTWGKYPTPTPPEAADVPADLMALVQALDPHTLQFATSQADRDARFNGLPAGGMVVCAALKTAWISLGGSPGTGWQQLLADTGWVISGFIPEPAWATSYSQARTINGVTEIRAAFTLTGADMVAAANGDLVPTLLANTPAPFRPTTRGVYGGRGLWSAGYGVSFYISPAGNISLSDTLPGVTLATGGLLQISATWLEG